AQRTQPQVFGSGWQSWEPVDPPGHGSEYSPGGNGGPSTQTHTRHAVEHALLKVADLPESVALPWRAPERVTAIDTVALAATGWNREHLQEIESLAAEGKDLVGSLGHDGPLGV